MVKKNIALIGMPGCGKTTIGKLLAKRLKKDFIDMDDYIEKTYEESITEMFNIGEEYFRDFESAACKELSKEKDALISCGGGVIKRKDNIDTLKRSSLIVFIDRPVKHIIADIETEKRPLLKDGEEVLYNLYKERYELYNKYCDIKVENVKDIEELVKEIANQINESD